MSEIALAAAGFLGGGSVVALIAALLNYRRQGQTVAVQGQQADAATADAETRRLLAVVEAQAGWIGQLQERVERLERRVKELELERDAALAQTGKRRNPHG